MSYDLDYLYPEYFEKKPIIYNQSLPDGYYYKYDALGNRTLEKYEEKKDAQHISNKRLDATDK